MKFKNINKLSTQIVESASYFVDANIWIYSLQHFDTLKKEEKKYHDFFFEIIDSDLDPKPVLLMPTLLLSEIINTFLRKVAIPIYKNENGIPVDKKVDFKKDYRNTQHYIDTYEQLMDDIISLNSSIKYINDGNLINDHEKVLNKKIRKFDYNDYLYYSLCQKQNQIERVIILTHDQDFRINDLEVITQNMELLK